MVAATSRLLSGEIDIYLEKTAGDKPSSGVHPGARYFDRAGVEWLNYGDLTTSDWIQLTKATFGGTVATVDQGLPGAQSWPVKVDGWSYTPITLAAPTTTAVKASAGVLHAIVINKPVAAGVIKIYDNAAAAGTVIATITNPGTLLSDGPRTAIYDVAFLTALTIVTSGAAQDITVAYR